MPHHFHVRMLMILVVAVGLSFLIGRLTTPRPQPAGCPYSTHCPYCLGADGHQKGKNLTDNPFPPTNNPLDDSHPWNRWAAGWKAGRRAAEE